MLSRRSVLLNSAIGLALPLASRAAGATVPTYDVIVYGGTMSGIMAAVAAAREGLNVALIRGPNAIGGMPANGLSKADLQSPGFATGGLALQFYKLIGAHYGMPYAFSYEPHVAFAVAVSLLSEYKVTVYASQMGHAETLGSVVAMRLQDDSALFARYAIDSSYEGDLMAALGVTYRTGRESDTQYNESLAGFGKGVVNLSASPYAPDGSLLYGVFPEPNLAVGAADQAVMAYCYRLCLSGASNRLPFPEPPGYNPAHYQLRRERISSNSVFHPGGALPNDKFDLNGTLSIEDVDFLEGSWAYPTSSGAARSSIVANHYNYQAGLMYFLANDPGLPSAYRSSVRDYGLAADEFTTNGGWPIQLYVREAKRLAGQYVLTQSDVVNGTPQSDAIGIGYYLIDSHGVSRYPGGANITTTEGGFSPETRPAATGYPIPYRALTPLAADSKNLLVSVCVSASRIAFCSLRVEQHYMIMGEAAGVAAALALKSNVPVQDVDTSALQSKLSGYGAKLSG